MVICADLFEAKRAVVNGDRINNGKVPLGPMDVHVDLVALASTRGPIPCARLDRPAGHSHLEIQKIFFGIQLY